jgi:hypothetical protein
MSDLRITIESHRGGAALVTAKVERMDGSVILSVLGPPDIALTALATLLDQLAEKAGKRG